MPAPLTIVIPTLNAAEDLPGALEALIEGLAAGLIRELIVSDGGSTDETSAIADAAGATVLNGPAGRGGQLHRGAETARGTWILLLHADTQLSPGWTEAVQTHIAETLDTAAYFRLRFRSSGVMPALVSGWANLRSRRFGLPYGDQGLLISKAQLIDIGGVPKLPLMEDVALARALKGRLRMLPAEALTSAAKYERDGWFRRGRRNLWTLSRYLMGADPVRLAANYDRPSAN
ncbi:MAG: TIGR04283 family arsenosugar biosynthesis glycosyltransferase [Pseudomonadota bacterium]